MPFYGQLITDQGSTLSADEVLYSWHGISKLQEENVEWIVYSYSECEHKYVSSKEV